MTNEKVMQIFRDTAYVHTGGSDAELKAANYLKDCCAELGLEAHLETFEVQMATMHRADALSMYCTMFNIYGVPQKQFDAFYGYDALRQGETEVSVTENGAHPGVYAMASACGDYACIVVSQYRGAWKNYTFDLKGLKEDSEYTAEYYLTDDRHSFELVYTQINLGKELHCGRYLKENSILVIKIQKNQLKKQVA